MLQEYTGGAADAGLGLGEYIAVGSGYILMLGKMAWDKFFSHESKANDALIQQLTERIGAQEKGLLRQQTEVDHLRKMWHYEQDKVHRLVLYVLELKSELRRHGIEVPPSSTLYNDTDLAALLGPQEDDRDGLQDSDQEPAE